GDLSITPLAALLPRLLRGFLEQGIARGSWDGTRDPFPGLFVFDAADESIFFGRDEPIDDVLTKLKQSLFAAQGARWTILEGASGCGKSSLLRAGLIPRLRRDPSWKVIGPFRAADRPRARLDQALLEAGLKSLGALPPGAEPILAIDQLEELVGNAAG